MRARELKEGEIVWDKGWIFVPTVVKEKTTSTTFLETKWFCTVYQRKIFKNGLWTYDNNLYLKRE